MSFDLKPELKPAIHPLKRYRQLRAIAFFMGYWEECSVKACKVRKRCAGGTRGTYSRIGIPCCMEGRPERLAEAAEPDKTAQPLEPQGLTGVLERQTSLQPKQDYNDPISRDRPL
jgi:hypothetical protein